MTSIAKKKKCTRTLLDRGGEKGPVFRMKRDAMYHKKDRVANKKECNIMTSIDLDDVCTGNCYSCNYEEQCDNSQVAQDELLNSLDEW